MSKHPIRAPKRDTIVRTKPHANGQEWQWGYDAARDGYSAATCPFSGVLLRDKWMQGWREGDAEKNT